MLELIIRGGESWDEDAEQFTYSPDVRIELEHSLVALRTWESTYHKPFLTPDKKTEEQMLGYIVAMIVTPDISSDVLSRLTEEHTTAINDYINNPMTGTTVREMPQRGAGSPERISAELVYFWMSHYRIPFEAQFWHLNQLFALIKVHHAKNQPPKKMSKQANAQSMAEINAARKAKTGSKG